LLFVPEPLEPCALYNEFCPWLSKRPGLNQWNPVAEVETEGDNVMISRPLSLCRSYRGFFFWTLAASALLAFLSLEGSAADQKLDVLRIGTSGQLTGRAAGPKEKAGLDTLHKYIKEENGLDNEILRQKDWRELADKLAKGQVHLGVFQGYEFAWARQSHPELKPLAIAVNVNRYPIVYVVTQRDDPAKDFAGLQGQSLALPATGQGFITLYVDKQSEANGKNAETFFSKITTPDNAEDALDSVVDGKVQAVAIDQAALAAYKARKPGRFKQLKPVAHSQPLPPVVVTYVDAVVDEATRDQFKKALLDASKNEKGQTLLTLFHLTGFETAPEDFDKVLADTVKEYPPPKAKAK
jgi:ABC-type phosphate/phosphonate transport system substrate-binding protein